MGSTFIPSRCALIDTITTNRGTNVLIRGNMPLVGDDLHFAYDEIAAASGVDLTKFRLIDFPIIDNVGERDSWAAEVSAFGVDPAKYPTSYWPPYIQPGYDPKAMLGNGDVKAGDKSHPGDLVWAPFEGLPEDTNPNLFLYWPGWNYIGFVEDVIEVLQVSRNVAVYVHCMLGADRTGAFHIGYEMKAHGKSFAEASSICVNATSAGAPNADYERLAAAYAKVLGR